VINLLFGLKHREALQNVFAIAKYLKPKEKTFNLKVICFFNLQDRDLQSLNNYNIEVIKLPQIFKIKGDENKSKVSSLIKLLRFHNFLESNDYIISKNDSLIISPGGFLLDQLVACFAFQNKPSYILQNGFITSDEKIEKESKASPKLFNVFLNLLMKVSKAFQIRKNLTKASSKITYLAFNDEYRDYIRDSIDYIQNAHTVGSPRFNSAGDMETKYKKSILYLSSSALYENDQNLHELIKEQIFELYNLFSPKRYNLSFRPHPRDSFDWLNYLSGTDINILNKNEELMKQIYDHKFIVSERSTVILQGILSGKVSFWVHKDKSRIYDYEHIRCEDEASLVENIEQCSLSDENYINMHKNQLDVLKKRMISYCGEDSCRIILGLVQENINRLNKK
tara:strand:- start:1197 stop:2381 length:1185 start_codon:yes stop_codon:yes gene_type:complete